MARDKRETRAKAQWRSRNISLLLTEVLRHMEVAPMLCKWAKIAEIMGESEDVCRKKYIEIMNGVKIAREMQASTVNSKGEKRRSEAGKKAGKVGSKGGKSKKAKENQGQVERETARRAVRERGMLGRRGIDIRQQQQQQQHQQQESLSQHVLLTTTSTSTNSSGNPSRSQDIEG